METLVEILGMKRPHKGKNERYVGEVILARLGRQVITLFADGIEKMGYLIVTDEDSKSLFVAHLDTVHSSDGVNPLLYDAELEWMWKEDGTALGADDGAGIWVLYNMIEAGVPGSYLFTAGEERGGVGAKAVAKYYDTWLSSFDRAITFDRKGTTSVISHQMACGRCCSDEFAVALSAALTQGMGKTSYLGECEYKPDSTGVYTDTAEFVHMIPECTNVSAGYRNEHSGSETLDVGYIKALMATCLTLDWDSLPVTRDPSVVEEEFDWGLGSATSYPLDYGTGSYNRFSSLDDDWDNPGEMLRLMGDQEIMDAVIADPNWAGEMLLCAKYGELE